MGQMDSQDIIQYTLLDHGRICGMDDICLDELDDVQHEVSLSVPLGTRSLAGQTTLGLPHGNITEGLL